MKKRLYRGKGTKARELRSFEARYGKERGKKVYGATVGKVYREKYGHSYRRSEGNTSTCNDGNKRKRMRNW